MLRGEKRGIEEKEKVNILAKAFIQPEPFCGFLEITLTKTSSD